MGTIIHPQTTLRKLSEGKDLRQGICATLLISILYSVVCAIAAARGIEPTTKPTLPISEESYYFWETFFSPPLFLGTWFLFSWLNLKMGRAWGGGATFPSILVPLGFAFSIPMIPIMWTTDFICLTFLDEPPSGAFGEVWGIFYLAFTMLWMIAACIIATHEAHQISVTRAITTTVVSLLPTAFILGATIR